MGGQVRGATQRRRPANLGGWEAGREAIPTDVVAMLRSLLLWHGEFVAEWMGKIEGYVARAEAGFSGTIELLVFDNPKAFVAATGLEDPMLWRPHCSAMAMLAATNPDIQLVVKASPGTREPQPVQ